MKITLLTFAMLILCSGIGKALIPKASSFLSQISTQIGYAYLLASFYIFYITTEDLAITIFMIFTIPVVSILYKIFTPPYIQLSLRYKAFFAQYFFLFLSISIIFLIAAWPYLLNGFGEYWHGGNMDMEDGLYGRDAYLQGLIFQDSSNKGDAIRDQYLWYAGDEIRLQYSNLGFWSYFLQIPHGLDVVILNLLLNLVMMVMGCFLLAQDLFKLNKPQACIASIACVGSSFYLGTFWAGHIGSQMYGALFPAIIYLFFIPEFKNRRKSIITSFLLISLTLLFTYRQALIVGLGYLVVYKIWINSTHLKLICGPHVLRKLTVSVRVFFVILLFTLLLSIMWSATESYRLNGTTSYRAWGATFYPQILSIFLGITSYPYFSLFDAKNSIWIYVGSLVSLIVLITTYRYKGINNLFLKIFLISWIAGLLVFYIYIQDSYYLYKYFYLHQFIIILGFCAAVFSRKTPIITIFALGLLGVNIASDIGTGIAISNLETNKDVKQYKEVLSFGKDNLSSSFLDLGIAERMTVRQLLKSNRIDTKKSIEGSKYVIVRKNTKGDITGDQLGDIVFSTNKLDIRESPKSNILVLWSTFSEPEQVMGYPIFRWIKDGNDDVVLIQVAAPNIKQMPGKFLRFCTEKGPSAPLKLDLSVASSNKVLLILPLGNKKCAWVAANDVISSGSIVFKTGKTGMRLPFPEDRKLMYRISEIGWSNEIDDPISKKFIYGKGE